MTENPAEAHWQLIDERAYRVVEAVLTRLEGAVEYVLVGGWAVFSYGSGVPSVDTDLMVHDESRAFITAQLDEAGIRHARPSPECELLSMDGINRILGPDIEMGDSDAGYVPATVFRGRTVARSVTLPGNVLTATVPTADALAFTKLKAFHDRQLAWRALRDPAVMARIPTSDRPEVRERTEGYYYRKAGKDLFDLGFLCARATSLDQAVQIAGTCGLAEWLGPSIRRVPFPLQTFALGMVRDQPDVEAWLKLLETY